MTIEEAKKYFGEKFIRPTLGWLNEDTSKFAAKQRISKPKTGRKYLFHYNELFKDFCEQFGGNSGWVIGEVRYRRHGISFLRFEGSKDKNFEVEFYDGSCATQKLIPLEISKKEFKIKEDFMFIFDDMDGQIKFVD